MESSTTAVVSEPSATKRKRSPSSSTITVSAPPAKSAKPSPNQLSINYLVRQCPDDLPLINKDDTLPNLLQLVAAYTSVVDRHESLASNLGARPLAPILIKRFERCFDSSPKIVASHHKGAASSPDEATTHSMTWLEVIEFARSHPSQFTLSTFSEGRRVCQFYYPQKQLRVQISEEDFLFISSGRCQELIPPLPIWEDEEKEVGTCDVLEAKLKELTSAADMIAARTRQLSHRLKGRRAAILERRAEGGSGTPAKANASQTTTAPPSSMGANFSNANTNGRAGGDGPELTSTSTSLRNNMLRHFESLLQNQAQGRSQSRHHSISGPSEPHPQASRSDEHTMQENGSNASSLSPVPPNAFAGDLGNQAEPTAGYRKNSLAPQRPSSSTGNYAVTAGTTPIKHNFSRPLPPALESSQPFRPLCQAHMDSLARSQRVLPPCDRCRRLRMDCVKNLTSCLGCTKKHARCHWRDVSRDELGALDHLMDSAFSASNVQSSAMLDDGKDTAGERSHVDDDEAHLQHDDGDIEDDDDDDDSNPLEDLEALGGRDESEIVHQGQVREDDEPAGIANETAVSTREDDSRPATLAHKPDSEREETNVTADVESRQNEDLEYRDSTTGLDERHSSAKFELPPTHGGFRAVNAETLHGQQVALTAWRTG